VRAIFGEAYAHQGRQSLRRWVESTWLKLGGPQCLWDAGDVRDVQALLDLIDKLERSGRFDIAALEAGITKLYAAPDVHADGTLQFMTIHNSKGLEFDTVILPGLHRQSAKGDAPLILWEEVALEEANSQIVAAPWRPKHHRDEMPSTYDYLQGLENERSANETARVLYVAATRAVRKLHLVAAIKLSSKDEVKPPNGTFLELLWDNVGGEFMRAGERLLASEPLLAEESTFTTSDEPEFIPQLIRLAHPAVHGVFAAAASLSGGESYQLATEPGNEDTLVGRTADALIGSLAHRYMELIAQDGIAHWPISRLATLTPVMAHWLASQGLSADQAALGAQRVSAMLDITLASKDGRWVLQRRDNDDAELAMSRADKLLVSTHVVDRTFIEDGVRWIIDYKSVQLDPAIVDTDLQALAGQYREQLTRYALLFAEDGLAIRQAIYFLSIGRMAILA